MSPLRQTRKSRRLSCKSPVQLADYDWQGAASLHLLHSASDVESAPSAVHTSSPSPSACISDTSDTSPSIVTHLPFAPGSSHTRNRKEGHIPRPPNAFMVFRSWLWNKDNLKSIERDNRNVSRIAGRYWNKLSEAERAPFRCMAEEAKARHAQLYPEYRYSPGSQKRPKVSQRRSQRATDVENAKCKKVADLLLGGVASRDLAKYLGDTHATFKQEGQDAFHPAAQQTFLSSYCVAPSDLLRMPLPPCVESSALPQQYKKSKELPAPLISQYPFDLPTLPLIEERSETTQTLEPSAPQLVYPQDQEFVATADIPYLSLDGFSGWVEKKAEDDDRAASFPSHLEPASLSVFSGVKPEATSFVDSCVLGAHTTGVPALPSPVPFPEFDVESYLSLAPFGSPVFTNPFGPSTPTAKHTALLGTLDQMFGQPVSPFTTFLRDDVLQ